MATIRERAADAVKRAEAATTGPWSYDTFGTSAVVLSKTCAIVAETEAPDCPEDEGRDKVRAIATFIAEARADVPDLGKAILRLTGPAMRDRIALAIVAGCMRGAAPNALADSIMDLLQEEPA